MNSDQCPLTNADIYKTKKAFREATNRWRFVRNSIQNANWLHWVVVCFCLVFGVITFIAYFRNYSTGNSFLTIIYLSSSGTLFAIPAMIIRFSLIPKYYKKTLDLRKDELGLRSSVDLDLSELEFVLFRNSVPKNIRYPENLKKLENHINVRNTFQKSLIADHPLLLSLIALLAAISGGIASQSQTILIFSIVIFFILIGIWIIAIFPGLFIGEAQQERDFLGFIQKLEFEPLEEGQDS